MQIACTKPEICFATSIVRIRTILGGADVKDKKIRRSVRIVRTENGFTDRTNRTVREKDSRIVNTAFQSVKESVCDQVKLGKIRRSVRNRTVCIANCWRWIFSYEKLI